MRKWLAVVIGGLVLAACGGDGPDAGDERTSGRIQVVASFYPIAEAAGRVGRDLVEVVNLTPAGTEPHDLELTPDQVDDLEDADLVLYLGRGFQPAVEAVAERRDGPTVDLLEDLPVGEGAIDDLEAEEAGGEEAGAEHAGEKVDPHFWLDPTLLSRAAETIESELASIAPGHAAALAAGLAAYRSQLTALDQEFENGLSNCQRDEIVTSHAAFFYLADRYDLAQVAIAGLSPEAEPDPRRIAELTTLIKDRGITTVFYETLVPPSVARALAREAQVKTSVLDPMEGLSDDALAAGRDYSAVMRENLAALRTALGCP